MAVISHISITILPGCSSSPYIFSSTRTPEVDCSGILHVKIMASRCDAAGEEQSELISFMRQCAKPNKTQILLSTARYNISFVLQTEKHSHGSSSHAAEGAFYPGEKGVVSAYQSVPPVYISLPRHIHSSPTAIRDLLLCYCASQPTSPPQQALPFIQTQQPRDPECAAATHSQHISP